jgi:hypothetical protein
VTDYNINGFCFSFGVKHKYHLDKDASYPVNIPGKFKNAFMELSDGILTMHAGYEWDGASGPAIDTVTIIRASCFHDGLYQALREGWLPKSMRKAADKVLKKICLEDRMTEERAEWVYKGVRIGASGAAKRRKK